MKKNLLTPVVLLFLYIAAFSQKADSIYFNLYTDSLKKGAYNYINVEGRMADGKIRPLDSSQLIFISSYGKFSGNSLWLPFETTEEKINITVRHRQNPAQVIHRTIYIKKKTDDGNLKTADQAMEAPERKNRNRRQ
ncbi:MAG: hypothetical protein KF746_04965 [Chitinophagaceae bacterium]|nr:hypothetical protein [Chitinophagaceae bacterium]